MYKLPIEKSGVPGMKWGKGKKSPPTPKSRSGYKFPTPKELTKESIKEYKKYKDKVEPFASVAQAYYFAKNNPGLYLAKYEVSKNKNIKYHYKPGTENQKQFVIRKNKALEKVAQVTKKYGENSPKAKAIRRQIYAMYHWNTTKAKQDIKNALKG